MAERVAIFTFLENQFPWGLVVLALPPRDDCPELGFHYRPLLGTIPRAQAKVPGSQTDLPTPEEPHGEFLGELKPIEVADPIRARIHE